MSNKDIHPDICYRLRVLAHGVRSPADPRANDYVRWSRSSAGGSCGCFESLTKAKQSGSIRLGSGYQVWKFHCGTTESEIPYFMPELVYERPLAE